MPAVPGAGLVVIEAEFVFGGLEAVLNGPAMAFHRHQLSQRRTLGTPSREEGERAIGKVAADQQAPRPLSAEGAIILAELKIGEFEIGPVMQAWSLGSCARRQAPPGRLGKGLRDLGGGAVHQRLLAPSTEQVVGGNAQDIALARLAQHGLDLACAVDTVCRNE